MGNYAETALVRGLDYLASAQTAIAHNLANLDTASFKRHAPTAEAAPQDFASALDAHMPTVVYGDHVNWQPGNTRETGSRLDVALDGQLFLKVQGKDGKSWFTRNGAMHLDSSGHLVTANGLRYLDGSGQPLQLGGGDQAPSNLAIAPNGTISDVVTGQTWGPLGIWNVPDKGSLTPVGSGLYEYDSLQAPVQANNGVQQGYLEGSNVDSLQELVQMILVQRSFAATQRALTGVGQMQSSLINNMLR